MKEENTKTQTGAFRKDIFEYTLQANGHEPEYLWNKSPNFAIFRCPQNKKWYAAIMDITQDKIGLAGTNKIDVLNVKCEKELLELLLMQNGFFPAYHMNRDNWITVLLDGSIDKTTIFSLLDMSLELVMPKIKKNKKHN